MKEHLKKAHLLEGLSEETLDIIIEHLMPTFKTYKKNDVLLRAGEPFNSVGFLISGKIAGFRLDYEGNVTLHQIFDDHKTFGFEISATPTQISPLYLKCLTDSKIILLPYKELITLASIPTQDKLKLMENLTQLLANENMRKLYKIEFLAEKSIRRKIRLYLSFMAEKTGSHTFEIPFNRNELAQYLNVNRSALSAELSRMQNEGLIAYTKNKFTLNL